MFKNWTDAIAVAKLAVETATSDRDAEYKSGEGPRCRDLRTVVRTAQNKLSAIVAMPTASAPYSSGEGRG